MVRGLSAPTLRAPREYFWNKDIKAILTLPCQTINAEQAGAPMAVNGDVAKHFQTLSRLVLWQGLRL